MSWTLAFYLLCCSHHLQTNLKTCHAPCVSAIQSNCVIGSVSSQARAAMELHVKVKPTIVAILRCSIESKSRKMEDHTCANLLASLDQSMVELDRSIVGISRRWLLTCASLTLLDFPAMPISRSGGKLSELVQSGFFDMHNILVYSSSR